MAIAVGATGTTFAQPNFVQGTASPLGTVMSTQREFSIQGIVKEITFVTRKIICRVYYSEFTNKKTNAKWKSDSNICCKY
jgi:hypothetical protein